MSVVHREHGLKFVIFVDDHPPPHVHVTGRATARILLQPIVQVTDNRGLSKADIGRALKVVRSQREAMLEAWVKYMDDITDEEFEAANERGRIAFETEPHARSVRHDLKSGMTIVELYNGCTFAFPPRRLQGLDHASDQELLQVEVIGIGYGLEWESLDVHYTVGGLMAGRFGSAAYMARERAKLRSILTDELETRHDAA